MTDSNNQKDLTNETQMTQKLGTALLQLFKQIQLNQNNATTKDTIALSNVHAFQWKVETNYFGHKDYRLVPMSVSRNIHLADLHGIETQKQKIIQNTKQFLAGYPANHALLTGTRGGGKSSLIRALLNDYANQGLRLIEVSKNDLASLPQLAMQLGNIPNQEDCRYIIYCDDLAFTAEDSDYRMLKSMLDGSIASFGDKFLIYATSNRRHLIPQYMQDNINIYEGRTDEVNPLEQIDETVSLSDRFGLWLSFHPMAQDVFLQIVQYDLAQANITYTDLVKAEALQWASSRGGRSGRVAYQFAKHWIGKTKMEESS